jgi:hypothetical protein
VRHSETQRDTVRHSETQRDTARHSETQYIYQAIWCRFDIAWRPKDAVHISSHMVSFCHRLATQGRSTRSTYIKPYGEDMATQGRSTYISSHMVSFCHRLATQRRSTRSTHIKPYGKHMATQARSTYISSHIVKTWRPKHAVHIYPAIS